MHDREDAATVRERVYPKNDETARVNREFLIGLAAVTLLAAILRLWAIDFGLPLITHPDEPLIYSAADRMVTERTLDPRWFRYPAFVIDVQVGIIAVVRVIDRTVGLSDESVLTIAYTAGRLVMATLGIATVWLTGLIGRAVALKLANHGIVSRQRVASLVGIVAALVLAVSYIHVKDSHFLKPDIPTGFFTTLALWLSLRALDRGIASRRNWLLAAAAVGFAASAKYTGGVAAVMPAASLLLTAFRMRDRSRVVELALHRAIEMTVIAIVAFLIVNPYVVITPEVFLSFDYGIRAEIAHYRTGHDGAEGNDTWRWYLVEIWQRGFGPTLSPLVIVGSIVATLATINRRRHSTGTDPSPLLPILSFILIYYASIAPYPVRFDRQLIPILPPLAVIAGLAVAPLVYLFGRLSFPARRAIAVIGLVILTVSAVPVFARSLNWGLTAAQTDTRYSALDWLKGNAAPGTVVVREWHTPPVEQDGFTDIFVRKLNDNPLNWYSDNGVQYVVLSSYMYGRYLDAPEVYPEDAAFYERLLSRPVEAAFEGTNGPDIIILRLDEAAPAFLEGGQ